ncbi:hypothetical protein JS562_25075 [Agrobacterium sp. S2]|nr:hypothetical protein [Agrobacterium sp. S2]
MIEIQSSINRVVENAKEDAAKAVGVATAAQSEAAKATSNAQTAQTRVNRIAWGAAIGGLIAIVGVAVGLVTLVVNQFSFYDTQHQIYKDYVAEATAKIVELEKNNSDLEEKLKNYDQIIKKSSELSDSITSINKSIKYLQEENLKIKEGRIS